MTQPEGSPTTTSSPFTTRLRALHDLKFPPGSGSPRPSLRAVAEEIIQVSGTPISPGYLARLLNGTQDNPSGKVLRALAAYYGVHLGYFDETEDETQETRAQLQLAMALEDEGIRGLVVAVRDAGLSPAQVRALADIARVLGAMDDLPDTPPPPP